MAGYLPESVGAEPLLLLLAALILDAGFGDLRPMYRIVPHPVALIGALVGWCDRRLNRERRGERARLLRGALTVLIVVGLAAAVGWGVLVATRSIAYGWAVELVAIVALLAGRGLFDHALAVARALEQGGLTAGREAVRHIVGRDPATLDAHGVARGALESLAENFADGVVAPAFWYVLLGLPGLIAYKAINTLDSMIGHTAPRYRNFGMTAARLDDAVNWIPARLAALMLAAAAAFVGTARPAAAFAAVWRDAGRHRSPNAGWLEAAMAGALGLALAGPRRYADGTVVDDPWIGGGTARATARDIRRGLWLYAVAYLILIGIVAAILMLKLSM
jgi:adenosylcobinamide-phosphate synthase